MSDTEKDVSFFSCCTACTVRHGWFTCPDGKESYDFATVSKGLKVLAELVCEGRISPTVAAELERNIKESGLLAEDAELDELLDIVQRERERQMKRPTVTYKKRRKVAANDGEWNNPSGKKVLH